MFHCVGCRSHSPPPAQENKLHSDWPSKCSVSIVTAKLIWPWDEKILTSVTSDPPPLSSPLLLFSVFHTILDLFKANVISCQYSVISKEDFPAHAAMKGH